MGDVWVYWDLGWWTCRKKTVGKYVGLFVNTLLLSLTLPFPIVDTCKLICTLFGFKI
jgi:hypothetical protein